MITARGLVVATILLIAVTWIPADIYFYATGRETITRFTIRVSKENPAIPFLVGLAFGLLFGHLFLQF